MFLPRAWGSAAWRVLRVRFLYENEMLSATDFVYEMSRLHRCRRGRWWWK